MMNGLLVYCGLLKLALSNEDVNSILVSRADTMDVLLRNYDSRIAPNFNTGSNQDKCILSREERGSSMVTRPLWPGNATRVRVQLFILDIDSILEVTMDYTINILIRLTWVDKRMQYDINTTNEYIELDDKHEEMIWVPGLVFANANSAYLHTVTVPNKRVQVYRDGKILHSVRLALKLVCNMKLHNYPMDMQICPIVIESYSSTIRFKWKSKDPIVISDNLKIPQFTLMRTEVGECQSDHGIFGVYSCVVVDLHLKRNIGNYIVQMYIPSIIIVMLSWVSFWLDVDATQARIFLGVMTVLTMVTEASVAQASLPRVSYVKAVDVWVSVCLLFVFLAIVEYALIDVCRRRTVELRESGSMNSESDGMCITKIYHISRKMKTDRKEISPRGNLDQMAREQISSRVNLDKMARVIFPISFLMFNILYWTCYSL